MIKGFGQFINESDEPSIATQLEVLKSLIEIGLIDRADFRRDVSALRRDAMIKGEDIGRVLSPEVKGALETPEAQAIRDLGFEVVSSPTQLSRGNIVFAKPGYHRGTGYGIGFFPGLHRIRRMTPKSIVIRSGPFRRVGSMDDRIRDFSDQLSLPEFYKVAMQWAIDHVDFTTGLFGVKHRTAKDYFDKFKA